MSLQHYDRFLFRCDPGSPEHALLKNGVIVRWPKEDHFERIVEVDCTVKETTALLNLAKQLYPAVVPDIEKAIAAPRDS